VIGLAVVLLELVVELLEPELDFPQAHDIKPSASAA
jgi:hypothetical protein